MLVVVGYGDGGGGGVLERRCAVVHAATEQRNSPRRRREFTLRTIPSLELSVSNFIRPIFHTQLLHRLGRLESRRSWLLGTVGAGIFTGRIYTLPASQPGASKQRVSPYTQLDYIKTNTTRTATFVAVVDP